MKFVSSSLGKTVYLVEYSLNPVKLTLNCVLDFVLFVFF